MRARTGEGTGRTQDVEAGGGERISRVEWGGDETGTEQTSLTERARERRGGVERRMQVIGMSKQQNISTEINNFLIQSSVY